MKNKKLLLAVLALVLLVAVMGTLWYVNRPQPEKPDQPEETGEMKSFTLEVVHGDGTVRTFTLSTEEDFLGPVLDAEGIIEESPSSGMYDVVDGELADWNQNRSYWAFYVNGDYGTQGMDTTPVNDGDVFRLEYTIG